MINTHLILLYPSCVNFPHDLFPCLVCVDSNQFQEQLVLPGLNSLPQRLGRVCSLNGIRIHMWAPHIG